MALLHFQNLADHRPDILMDRTVRGLKPFYDFLSQTKRFMESDAAVKRLGWKKVEVSETATEGESAVWIQLDEAHDCRNAPESTFRAFMDENVNEVFETGLKDTEESSPQRKPHRRFVYEDRIQVIERDPENYRLLLERPPRDRRELILRPNTLTLHRQIMAIQALQNEPMEAQRPLLALMEANDHAKWEDFWPAGVDEWKVLTDEARPGTDEQRQFVRHALNTPDFMLLEGPPGSGKTTAICELILQLAGRDKRVLLCASTHVAVDNVLERLMDKGNSHRDLVIPVRIGERNNVSEKARKWQLKEFVKTERERLRNALAKVGKRSAAQEELWSSLRHGSSVVERMVLEATNLVCGTTIGILQHPDIKSGGQTLPQFDVLIVDEASKTTFQEFLVPALLAKRWVIVGDPKQLSPYVDDQAMAANIEPCLPDTHTRNACVDVFMATQNPRKQRFAAVAVDSNKARKEYLSQGAAHGVNVAVASQLDGLVTADIVVGDIEDLEKRADEVPLDVGTVRAPDGRLETIRRQASAWLKMARQAGEPSPDWAQEVGWRLARSYEQRMTEDGAGAKRLREQIEMLLPVEKKGDVWRPIGRVWQTIDRVRRVGLPSILESLRYGFERDPKQKAGTAFSDGLPADAMCQRHVLLSWQHRMHPEIAEFPHVHIYDGKALHTPEDLAHRRAWGFGGSSMHRARWLDVPGRHFDQRTNANKKEVETVISELREFDRWARDNLRDDRQPWEVAVLAFYRGQERQLREALRRWTGQREAMRHFVRRSKANRYLTIELCTVDRFQGHEADLVLLSLANSYPTTFLQSPNRLNVALTRARYQLVVIGNRTAMRRQPDTPLARLAEHLSWGKNLPAGVADEA